MTEDEKYEISGAGLSTKDTRRAQEKFDNYLSHYPHLNKLSDLALLEELVYLEINQEQYKDKIKSLEKKKKDSDPSGPPKALQDQLNNNLEQILKLKERLGLFEEKKNLDVWEYIKEIFAKFAIWREQNQDCRKVTCPFCSTPFFLMIRTDKYQEMEFPMFKGKILCNKVLHNMYKEDRISKDEYAESMGVSTDYIDWLDENYFEAKNQNKEDEDPTKEPIKTDSEEEQV